TIKQVVAAYFTATRAMDLEAWLANFAEDAVSYDPVGAPPTQGHRGLRQFWEMIGGAFETFGLTEENIFVAGNGAAVKWRGAGVGKDGRAGPFGGIGVLGGHGEGKNQKMYRDSGPAPGIAQVMGWSGSLTTHEA